ncbi:MAG: hypothetical protein KJO01_08375 [Gammaproteobacteria bacterium]|nr:hypothetical protein [Gammaproteobacteria bacterium]MBT8111649.1 hypothetical protein [Gammaproteobacteria bacterium]NND47825.1 hypothetical protein [Woeseiaceae bacterium]NNL46347.1 hypothetical protein [Woeseiaceae bacterium]
MNCISGLGARSLSPALTRIRRWASFLVLIAIAACDVESSESAAAPAARDYGAHYSVKVIPEQSSVEVVLEIRQPRHLLRELSFTFLRDTLSNYSGDGELQVSHGTLRWLPPAKGGKLRWRVHVAHRRAGDGYDAWLGPAWGIFRAEDIIPRAKTRALKGSTSNTTLSLDLPNGWSSVTEYSSISEPIKIVRPDRRFDQPTGWIAVGDIGVRREKIAGVRVAVAGPQGHAVRRMDMLALLNWTLPELIALLPQPLPRLTIVSAGKPMWRGGLSAPASLYVHADRPLISENGTSPLMHEVVHTALSIRSEDDADWITEGLAEYYGLELLKRGGAISARRHRIALAEQAKWATEADSLCGTRSTGATTALAVGVFDALNQEIHDKTGGAGDLDELLRQLLLNKAPIGVSRLQALAADIIGAPSDVLHIDKLPGCPRMTSGKHSS